MLTIYHLKTDDLEVNLAFDIAGGPNDCRPQVAAALFDEGHYEAVATCDIPPTNAGLEAAYVMTQNGPLTESWSRKPPIGLTVLEPSVIIDCGKVWGRRSTMIGDIVEGGGKRFVVDWRGFKPMPLPAKEVA